MAKKIRIEENPIINKEPIKKSNKYEFFRSPSLIFIVMLVVSIFINIVLYSKYNKVSIELDETNVILISTKEELANTEDELEDVHSSLFSITGWEYSTSYIIDKLYFMDEYVVIVPEDNDDYYYSYDCYEKLYSDSAFWIYNIESAKGRGYKKGTC